MFSIPLLRWLDAIFCFEHSPEGFWHQGWCTEAADAAACPSLGDPFKCLGCYTRGSGMPQVNSLKAHKEESVDQLSYLTSVLEARGDVINQKQCHLCSLLRTAAPGVSLWRSLLSALLSLMCLFIWGLGWDVRNPCPAVRHQLVCSMYPVIRES